jgi:DNA-binding NarL/FixJ family response regulator
VNLNELGPIAMPPMSGDDGGSRGKAHASTVQPSVVNVGASDSAGPDVLNVLLIDPSPLSRSCFLAALTGDETIAITAAASIAEVGLQSVKKGKLHVVVLRIAGEDLTEDQLTQRLVSLRDSFPGTNTMLLAATDAPDQLLCALRQGIAGFITTDLSLAATVRAIHLLHNGLAIYPYTSFHSLQRILATPHLGVRSKRVPVSQSHAQLESLTPRQQEVLQLLVEGMSNKSIAYRLGISESTVKVHIRAIMERTGVISRTQIISRFFSEKG